MALRSLWPFWLLGAATLWLYGIGLIFIVYAAGKWVRVRYPLTNRRVIKAIDHYAFLLRVETEDVLFPHVTGMAVSRSRIGRRLGYADVTIQAGEASLTMTGLGSIDELRDTLRPYL